MRRVTPQAVFLEATFILLLSWLAFCLSSVSESYEVDAPFGFKSGPPETSMKKHGRGCAKGMEKWGTLLQEQVEGNEATNNKTDELVEAKEEYGRTLASVMAFLKHQGFTG
ncbi:hypothetical protein RHSIM_Rhsim05G0159400 [Rhododendron simsii]|uniref:Uncharacterized protein n=1 Tax=Rhododendron simsii TaxID=118357 RepID=A0A834LMD4_RHOSS|nr:hypothetical protein RHSIM_Rhsim05G0159400 [Rhododendron simsii]